MTLTVIDRVSDPGGSENAVNEDVAGHSSRAAWVLDGATGLSRQRLLEGPSDAAWLATRYDAVLRRFSEDPQLDARKLVSIAIEEVGKAFRKASKDAGDTSTDLHERRDEVPSAGMALVRVTDGGLEYASLGDCRAIIALPDGSILPTRASKLNELDREVLREMERLLHTGEARDHAEARRAVDGMLRSNRAKLNTPDGYWVLSIHTEAVDGMDRTTIPLAPGETTTGLLVTDGLYRLVDTFKVYPNDATFLAEARRQGLGALLGILRTREDDDPGCTKPVRFKQKDDATGLLFEATALPPGA